MGLSVSATRMVSTRVKRYLGKLAYAFEGLRLLRRLGSFRCRLRGAEGAMDFDAHQLIIANGCFYGDTVLAADASVTNNQFLVCAMAPVHGWRLVRLWASFLIGKRTRMPELHCFPAHEFWVETDPPQYIGIDGEETMQTPAHFSVAPQALQVLVPAGFRV